MARVVIAIPLSMRSRFARSLRKLRLGQGLSQNAMAARYGLARSTWTGYERCDALPPLRVLIGLHLDYGISIDYLLGIRSLSYHPTAGMLSEIKRRNPLPRIPG